MNTTNTTQDIKTTQEGAWIGIPEIDAPEYARPHKPEGLDSLGIDMGKNGQLQNIVLIKKADGRYECIIGNGRLEAAKKLGWSHIRADVKEGLSESQKLLMTLAENEEREDASPFYTASLYDRLMKAEKLQTPGELADKIGKERTTVGKYLSLAEVPEEVRKSGNRFPLGLRHWLEIAKLPKPEEQVQLAQECAEKDYSVRELQARVKKLLGKPVEAKEVAPKTAPAFQFHWKGRELQIKVRPFRPDQEGWNDYAYALEDAASKYRAAFPLPEEVSAAA